MGGYGGFGQTAGRISQYYAGNDDLRVKILLARKLKQNGLWRFRQDSVDFISTRNTDRGIFKAEIEYSMLTARLNLLLSIDLFQEYGHHLNRLPHLPLIIWLRDPKGDVEWDKIITLPQELKSYGNRDGVPGLRRMTNIQKELLAEIVEKGKRRKRKILIVTNGDFLMPRAEKLFGLEKIEPFFLPNPIEYPEREEIRRAARPTVCFIGRQVAIKRPWLFYELAKRFPSVKFHVCGIPNSPDRIKDIMEQYTGLSNVEYHGVVRGEKKKKILSESWVLINTSIHEGLPCTFLEAFSYEMPVLSCLDPDALVSRFGLFTGEFSGYAYEAIDKFASGLEYLLTNKAVRTEKGRQGRGYIEKLYNFSCFEKRLNELWNRVQDPAAPLNNFQYSKNKTE